MYKGYAQVNLDLFVNPIFLFKRFVGQKISAWYENITKFVQNEMDKNQTM